MPEFIADPTSYASWELMGDVTVAAISTLVKDITEELGYTEWDLVGHSLGGFVAMHMASIWPDRVLSVGMVSGTTFSVINSVDHPVRNFFELPGFTMLWRVMQFLAVLGPIGPAMVRGLGEAGILRVAFAPLFRRARRVPASLIAATARDLRPRSFAAAAEVPAGTTPTSSGPASSAPSARRRAIATCSSPPATSMLSRASCRTASGR